MPTCLMLTWSFPACLPAYLVLPLPGGVVRDDGWTAHEEVNISGDPVVDSDEYLTHVLPSVTLLDVLDLWRECGMKET